LLVGNLPFFLNFTAELQDFQEPTVPEDQICAPSFRHIPFAHPYMMNWLAGRASSPAAFGGAGFQPAHPHRQNAGATKNSSRQFLMGLCHTHKA
jgi:hypothetical protein